MIWRIVGEAHKAQSPWIEETLYNSYQAADKARLALIQKYPRVDFFVQRVPALENMEKSNGI